MRSGVEVTSQIGNLEVLGSILDQGTGYPKLWIGFARLLSEHIVLFLDQTKFTAFQIL
jgi:hypothetical protein